MEKTLSINCTLFWVISRMWVIELTRNLDQVKETRTRVLGPKPIVVHRISTIFLPLPVAVWRVQSFWRNLVTNSPESVAAVCQVSCIKAEKHRHLKKWLRYLRCLSCLCLCWGVSLSSPISLAAGPYFLVRLTILTCVNDQYSFM